MVTIVPSFNSDSTLPLLSSTQKVNVGPFIAGMPSDVPLWVAKALYRRNLAQIEPPEWLSVDVLTSILQEERESTLLSRRLPYHYYEIARALDCCLSDNNHNGAGGGNGKATKVVLQDLVAVRSDKLRMHFHELSKSDLVHPPQGYDDMDEDGNYIADQHDNNKGGTSGELPIISVTGICSYELNKVGPFLQRAFSDYGYLTRRPSPLDDGTAGHSSSGRSTSKGDGSNSNNKTYGKENVASDSDDDDYDIDHQQGGNSTTENAGIDKTTTTSRRLSMARSRLRRFRS